MFSALMPTKGRVALAKRAIESIRATSEAEITLGVDESERDQYAELGVQMVVLPDGHGGSWKMHRLAQAAAGEAMMCFHDDMVAITPGWDQRFLTLLRDDPYQVLYFMDDREKHRGLCEPVVSREWVECGGFYPDFFHHYEGDTFAKVIAERLGVLRFVPDVVLEHRHFKHGKAVFDNTYEVRGTPHKVNSYLVQKAQRAALNRIRDARNHQ